MKNRTFLTWVATLAFSALLAGPANAILIAGWDFSQYVSGGGALSTDGTTLRGDLPSNYSNRDPLQLGPTAAVYGTMYINGNFGSTLVALTGQGDEPILPTEVSLGSNLNAPVLGGNTLTFDSLDTLRARGQTQANALKMSLLGATPIDIVFQASTLTLPGTDWVVSFAAGRGGTANSSVSVEFSTLANPSASAGDWTPAGSFALTSPDALFDVPILLPGGGSPMSAQMFVRLRFAGPNTANFDDVAINANLIPEPGTGLLLAAGLAGLAACRRRRA